MHGVHHAFAVHPSFAKGGAGGGFAVRIPPLIPPFSKGGGEATNTAPLPFPPPL